MVPEQFFVWCERFLGSDGLPGSSARMRSTRMNLTSVQLPVSTQDDKDVVDAFHLGQFVSVYCTSKRSLSPAINVSTPRESQFGMASRDVSG